MSRMRAFLACALNAFLASADMSISDIRGVIHSYTSGVNNKMHSRLLMIALLVFVLLILLSSIL